jgi:two-component system sensor histidine kinase KdpD
VIGPAGAVAVMGVGRADAGEPLHPGQALLLRSLLDQCGLALSRIVAEEEARALGEVQERDRLRAALLSSVSHDLRTPLTTVLATLRAMRAAAPEQEAQLAAARTEAERLNALLPTCSTWCGSRPARWTGWCSWSIWPRPPAARSRTCGRCWARRIAVAMPDDLPLALLDPQLFHHCLINLIDNAAKHGGPDGTITVAAETAADGGLVLSVQDSGPGLPPGRAAVFAMFTRLEGSDRTGGSGLGLAIVKGLPKRWV